MTTISVTWSDPTPAGSYAGAIQATAQAAADAWAARIQGFGTIEVSLRVGDVGSSIASGGTVAYQMGGLYVPTPVNEARTGADLNGASPDITLTLSPNYVDRLFYDPASPVPAGRIDGFSVFEHEIGHGLGFLDFDQSAYSAAVRTDAGGSVFTGANARAAYGGDVPLDGSLSHLSVADLMNPVVRTGVRLAISDVDLGILQDVGMPIATARADRVALDSGADTFAAGAGDDTVSGGAGADAIYGNLGRDIVYGNLGDDRLFGGQDADVVYGGQGNDLAYGNLGDDVVYGNFGNDTLFGGQGDDLLYGGSGDDALVGGQGNDTLVGGAGADRYVVGSGADLVLGFDANAGDRLDLGGQGYTLTAADNGDALLVLAAGSVRLAGVSEQAFRADAVA